MEENKYSEKISDEIAVQENLLFREKKIKVEVI